MLRKISVTVILAGAVLLTLPSQGRTEEERRRPAEVMQGDADNTRVNKRDRIKEEATADKQGQKSSDRRITQEIRRAITKDSELSMYARNVKIITQDGKVTLKGPVRTEKEKTSIEEIAALVAGKDKVTNEIQIAPGKK